MLLFGSRKQERDAQRVLLRLMNQHSSTQGVFPDGPRDETRMNLTLVVLVIPTVGKEPIVDEAYTATTKDVSSSGMSIVSTVPYEGSELAIGFASDGELQFLRGEIRHREALSGGFHLMGVHMAGVLSPSDYPKLASMRLG